MTRPTKYGRWTTHKLKRLRKCYRTMSNDELVVEFAPHPIKSILSMAYGMKLRKMRDWKLICAKHKPVILRWRGTT